jgi:hypothetical protein
VRFRHEESMPPNTAAINFLRRLSKGHNGAMDQVQESECAMWSVQQMLSRMLVTLYTTMHVPVHTARLASDAEVGDGIAQLARAQDC